VIREAVSARQPVDAREQASVRTFIEHFDRLDDPCNEHADTVHVTGSAIIVGSRGVVLHLHKRLNMWLQPGGHIDPGETPWDAARREAEEETGLPVEFAPGASRADADAHADDDDGDGDRAGPTPPPLAHVDVHPGPRGHTHLDLRYVLFAPPVDPTPPPGESQDVRWFDWADAIEAADPGLAGALAACRGRFEQIQGT